MDNSERISSWLCDLPETTNWSYKRSKKQKLVATISYGVQQVANSSPFLENDISSIPKRRCSESSAHIGTLLNLDVTPRPNTDSFFECLSKSTSKISFTTLRTPLTRRQMIGLYLSELGVECKALDVDVAPKAVQSLVNMIEEIGCALDILPHSLRPTIMEKVKKRGLDP